MSCFFDSLCSFFLVYHVQTHTHTHPSNGPLSGTTRMSWYQKGKSSLDFTEARDSEWQWHQLGMCKSAPRARQITTPAPHHSVFYRLDALPSFLPGLFTMYKSCQKCGAVCVLWPDTDARLLELMERTWQALSVDQSQIGRISFGRLLRQTNGVCCPSVSVVFLFALTYFCKMSKLLHCLGLVFPLFLLVWFCCTCLCFCLQCFDAVGWAAGRPSGL